MVEYCCGLALASILLKWGKNAINDMNIVNDASTSLNYLLPYTMFALYYLYSQTTHSANKLAKLRCMQIAKPSS